MKFWWIVPVLSVLILLGSCEIPSPPEGEEGIEYVAVSTGGGGYVYIYDVKNPEGPKYVSGHNVGGFVDTVYVSENLLYASLESHGFAVLNVDNPENLAMVDQADTGNTDYVIERDGKIYVGGDDFYVYRLQGSALQRLGVFDGELGEIRGIEVKSDRAYLAECNFGVQILDVSTDSPKLLGQINLDSSTCPQSIALNGDYAYVADGSHNEFFVLNVSQATPTIEKTIELDETSDYAKDVFVDRTRNILYVAAYNALYSFDVSDPANPVKKDRLDIKAWGVFASGEYAYVAGGGDGLYVVEISEDGSLRVEGRNTEKSGALYDIWGF